MRTGLETARAAEGTLGAHGHGPARRVAVSLGASARGACGVSQGAGGSVRGKSRRPGFDLSTGDDAVITGMVGGLGRTPLAVGTPATLLRHLHLMNRVRGQSRNHFESRVTIPLEARKCLLAEKRSLVTKYLWSEHFPAEITVYHHENSLCMWKTSCLSTRKSLLSF